MSDVVKAGDKVAFDVCEAPFKQAWFEVLTVNGDDLEVRQTGKVRGQNYITQKAKASKIKLKKGDNDMEESNKAYGHDRIVKQMSKALDEAIDKVELTEALCNWTDMLNDLTRIRGELADLRRKYPNEFK